MRTTLITLTFLPLIFVACNKSSDIGDNPVRNNIGYLLTRVVEGRDTLSFQYDNNNRLTGLINASNTFNYRGIYELFQYNSRGELTNFKYTFSGSNILSSVHNFSYQNDTIIKSSLNANSSFGDALKFVLLNNRIIETQKGTVSNGILMAFRDTTHYLYKGDNLIKCIYPFLTNTYQPIDSFLYNTNYHNPYSLLQKHIWSLITGPGLGLATGESRNTPSTITRAYYQVMGTDLLSSGFLSLRIISVENAAENPLLPKTIKYQADDGSEVIARYFYQKQK